MGIKAQRAKKMTLEDIPKVNTAGRQILLKITNQKKYIEAIASGISGFTNGELASIELHFRNGIRMNDIQNELKKKGWLVKPHTIKHYIQVNQLPKPKEARKKTESGAISIYPKEFIRHLNLIRFAMQAGRHTFEEITEKLSLISDFELLEARTDDDCYKEYDGNFFHPLLIGIERIDDGLYFGKKAVESLKNLFSSSQEINHKKIGIRGIKSKYLRYIKMLERIEKLKDKLKDQIYAFEDETKSAGIQELSYKRFK